jgi:hypothetical protein
VHLNQRDVSILLTDEGKEVLELAQLNLPATPSVQVDVEDTDDLGVWARITRLDGDHVILIRWDYILTLDFPAGERKKVGWNP